MRPPVAPSAARTAISCWRCCDRASSRLATFAQAISSTSETAPSRISSDGRLVPATSSGRLRMPTLHFALNGGYSFTSCRLMLFNSASARSMVVSGLSRPNTTPQCGDRAARGVPGVRTSGTKNWSSRNSHAPRGRMPTTVRETSSRMMVVLTIDGLPPKRERHNSSVRMTTSLRPPGRSSSSMNPRPSSGPTPSTCRRSWLAAMPCRRSVAPLPRRLYLTRSRMAIASNCVECVFQSR